MHLITLDYFITFQTATNGKTLKTYLQYGQGPKLRLTGRQCDQKLGVGDQNFRTGRQ